MYECMHFHWNKIFHFAIPFGYGATYNIPEWPVNGHVLAYSPSTNWNITTLKKLSRCLSTIISYENRYSARNTESYVHNLDAPKDVSCLSTCTPSKTSILRNICIICGFATDQFWLPLEPMMYIISTCGLILLW